MPRSWQRPIPSGDFRPCHLRSFSPARRGKEDELDKRTEHPIRLSLLPYVTELGIGKDAIPLPVRSFGSGHSWHNRRTEVIAPRGMPIRDLANNRFDPPLPVEQPDDLAALDAVDRQKRTCAPQRI